MIFVFVVVVVVVVTVRSVRFITMVCGYATRSNNAVKYATTCSRVCRLFFGFDGADSVTPQRSVENPAYPSHVGDPYWDQFHFMHIYVI